MICKMKRYLYLLCVAVALTLTSCFSDDTTLGINPISEIVIDSTTISSVYNISKNDTLVITPRISQTLDAQEVSYTWEINLQPYSHDTSFVYVARELGSYECRLIVENVDGKSFFPFTVHVNSPYEEGLAVISRDADGSAMLSFMLTPPDGSAPTGFMTGDQFAINNEDVHFAANPTDVVQSSGSLIISCRGTDDNSSPATIYYLNEKTFVIENMLTAPEYPDFRPTQMSIPSIGSSGVAYPVLCENGRVYEFSTTEGALAKPVKLPYTYAQTTVVSDRGSAGSYNILYWDIDINALSMIYRGYGPYYCSKTYHLGREACSGSANYFDGHTIRKMVLVNLTDEQLGSGLNPEVLVLTDNLAGLHYRAILSVDFWEYNYETLENVLVDNGGYKMCGIGSLSLAETTPCVANRTYYSLLFAEGNKVRRWNYTSSQHITAADNLLTVGTDEAIITALELSTDHTRTYVAFYEPNQDDLNGSVWVFDTDKGTVLEKYDNVCYQPVKMIYKKK